MPRSQQYKSAASITRETKEWSTKPIQIVLQYLRARCLNSVDGNEAVLRQRAQYPTSADFLCPYPDGNALYVWKKIQAVFSKGSSEVFVLITRVAPGSVVALDCGSEGLVPCRYARQDKLIFPRYDTLQLSASDVRLVKSVTDSHSSSSSSPSSAHSSAPASTAVAPHSRRLSSASPTPASSSSSQPFSSASKKKRDRDQQELTDLSDENEQSQVDDDNDDQEAAAAEDDDDDDTPLAKKVVKKNKKQKKESPRNKKQRKIVSIETATASSSTTGTSGGRYALVIGNNAYKNKGKGSVQFDPLENCVKDAQDMCLALTELGYAVTMIHNVKKGAEFLSVFQDFFDQVGKGDRVLFYYAGHAEEGSKEGDGIVNVGNAFIPTEEHHPSKRVTLQLVHSLVDKKKLASLGFLMDACRSRGAGTRQAKTEKAGNWIIPSFHMNVFYSFGCSPGETCSDSSAGSGSNGLYTKHLLAELNGEQDINTIFRRVCAAVVLESKNRQRPWYNESVVEDAFHL